MNKGTFIVENRKHNHESLDFNILMFSYSVNNISKVSLNTPKSEINERLLEIYHTRSVNPAWILTFFLHTD